MKMNIKTNNSGIALILVLGILAVLAVLATTFAFNMRLEQKAARNYLDAVSADCIARLGIEHAIALLHNDVTNSGDCEGYDWNGDTWGYLDDGDSIFGAYEDGGNYYHENLDNYEHTCTPGYSGTDAQWKGIWEDGVLVGRYAVLVLDESGKMNINMAGNIASGGSHGDNEGWTTFEISIEDFFNELGLSSPGTKAEDLIKYRYGGGVSPQPGSSSDDDESNEDILEYDGIDNDGDGIPDEFGEGDNEPDEFTPWYPRGSNDDTAFSTIMEMRFVPGVTTVWDSVKNLITVQSRTRNQYWDSGWKPKLNINAVADVSKLSDLLDDAGVSGGPQGAAQKACNITDYRDENYIISAINSGGWIYGVEPILINEVLANSNHTDNHDTGDLDASSDIHPYGGLAPNTCYRVTIDTSTYDNNPAPGEFTVTIGGTTKTVDSDPYDFVPSNLAEWQDCISTPGGQLQITFTDTSLVADGEVSRVVGVMFTCAEFVELCNISDTAIDLVTAPAWTIAIGSGSDVAIPAGAKFGSASYNDIDPGSYFVLTNDPDLFAYSYGDRSGTWGDVAAENVPVADMSGSWTNGYATDGELNDSGEPGGGAEEDIVIKNPDGLLAERAVSADLYSTNYGPSGRIGESREKNDPTVRDDWGNNTNNRASPDSATNSRISGHTLDEIYIQNGPFANIGEISNDSNVAPNFYKGVRSGGAWAAISGNASGDDLGEIAERITVDAVRLDAETFDATDAGTVGNYWSAAASGPYLTKSCVSSFGSSDTSYWDWQNARLQPVQHTLYIYGLYTNDTDTDYLSVYLANDYSSTPPGFPVSANYPNLEFEPSDGVKVGTVGTGNIGSDGRFAIKLETDGAKTGNGDVYFDYLLLVPQSTLGKVNINTAALQVLKALPGLSAAQAEAIYNSVHNPVGPYDDTPYEKLGDVLRVSTITAAEFAPISNLISVHSDVFKIICLAQTIQDLSTSHAVDEPDHVVLAEKKVEVIVDRSTSPIRILSWKEITE